MIKCPFCGFDNEDGALFCEQCKSDISNVASTAAPPVVPVAAVEVLPVEALPMDVVPVEVMEVEPIMAAVEVLEPIVEAAPAPPPPPPPPPPPAPVAAAAPPPPPPPPAPAPVAAPPAPATAAFLAADAKPILKVVRGLKVGAEFPLYEGNNFIGRADDQPVDIDLEPQEAPDRVWISRQHALVTFEKGTVSLEDLNSSNGTFLNRKRLGPGQPEALKPGDVIQIGTVQLKLQV